MKKIDNEKLDRLLSLYIDGMLSETEMKEVESRLSMDISAKKHLEELKKLKGLLTSKKRLEPDIGFMTRFTAGLEDARREERSLLPFSRKHIPVAAALMTTVVVVLGIVVFNNLTDFMNFVNDKKETVKNAYNKNFMQGSLLPLFSRVDKDRALQFSLFGTLPFDEKSETGLRVDERSEKGYRIEVGKEFKNKAKSVTFDRFMTEVKPTKEQKEIIDSLLELTGRRIESSVLIGENNAMVIAPDLAKLNKIMVTNIASCLDQNQQARFERLLEAHDAPYAVKSQAMPSVRRSHVFQKIPNAPQGDRFVIITPDTMIYSQIHIDFDSLRRQMAEDLAEIRMRRDAILKKLMRREFQRPQMNVELPPPVQVSGDKEFLTIEINSQGDDNEPQQMHVIIRPRERKLDIKQRIPDNTVRVRGWKDTSSH